MDKEEIVIALCDMISRLTKDINKSKEQKGASYYALLGVRTELLNIVTGCKEEPKEVF